MGRNVLIPDSRIYEFASPGFPKKCSMLKNTILAQNAPPQPSCHILTKAEFRKSTKIKIYIDNSTFIPI